MKNGEHVFFSILKCVSFVNYIKFNIFGISDYIEKTKYNIDEQAPVELPKPHSN